MKGWTRDGGKGGNCKTEIQGNSNETKTTEGSKKERKWVQLGCLIQFRDISRALQLDGKS